MIKVQVLYTISVFGKYINYEIIHYISSYPTVRTAQIQHPRVHQRSVHELFHFISNTAQKQNLMEFRINKRFYLHYHCKLHHPLTPFNK